MTNGPLMNPLAVRILGGEEFRDALKAKLLEQAAATDDEAYATRLREAAAGTRPLRSLIEDPAFLQSRADLVDVESRVEAAQQEAPGSPEQVMDQLRAQLLKDGASIPSVEEARSAFPEVQAIQAAAARVREADREASGHSDP